MKDRIEKMKTWLKEHPTQIAVGVLGTLAAAAALVAHKDHQIRVDERRAARAQWWDENELEIREEGLAELKELVAFEEEELEALRSK